MKRPSPSLGLLLVGLLVSTRGAEAECPKEHPDAVALANKADETRRMDLVGAIAEYEQALTLDPASFKIRAKLLSAYRKREDWERVIATLDVACKLAPKHAGHRFERGVAHVRVALKELRPTPSRAASLAAAQQDLEAAVALDPGHAEAHFELAELLLRLPADRTREKAALALYTKAIELAPDRQLSYARLGDLYLRLGFPDHAKRTLLEGISRTPEAANERRFPLLMLLGQIEEERGDMGAAIGRYEEARVACGPCNDGAELQQLVFFRLGSALAAAKPPRKSEAMAQLQAFTKIVCKGAAAPRYADPCALTQQIAATLAGALP